MILDTVRASDLVLVNKFFTKSLEQTYTYKRGQNRTKIEYMAIRRDILGNVVNCKVIPGKPITTQHRLLVMDLKISKKRKIKKICAKRINWWKLKTEKGEELRQKLAEFMVSEDEEEILTWDNTYPKIIETAKEVLGENKLGTYLEKKYWWWNEEVQEAVKKKVAFKKWQQTRTK